MTTPTGAYVVTVTPTIMSGTVVRWFTDLDAAEHFQPFLSASEHAVVTHLEGLVTPGLRSLANDCQKCLQAGDYQSVKRLETHRRKGLTGPFALVASGEQGTSAGSTPTSPTGR